METFTYELKIPEERVAVLIGKNGATKKMLESQLGIKISVDSEEGDVIINGEDGLKLFTAREIIRAVGRGFNPETALKLATLDYAFELMRIDDYSRTKNDLFRLRGRVIGKDGKSREVIEELTGCDVSVYGKTVGIIGPVEQTLIARRAVDMLLQGSMHATVYKFLEGQKRAAKMAARSQMRE